MNRRGRGFASAVLLASLVVLAGCAPEGPRQEVTEPAAATPAPTPTLEEPTDPVPVVPGECADFAPTAEFTALWGAAPTEQPPALSTFGAALTQQGYLSCSWALENSDTAHATITPDGPTRFAESLGAPSASVERGRYGDDSKSLCDEVEDFVNCTADVVIGPYFVSVRISTARAGLDEAAARAGIDAATTALVARVEAAGAPRPKWTPPTPALAANFECTPLADQGAVLAALGSPSLTHSQSISSGDWSWIDYVGIRDAGWTECGWQPPWPIPAGELGFVHFSYAPGSAWAWPEVAATGTAAAVPGTEAAVTVCDVNGCRVEFLVADTWVSLVANNATQEQLPQLIDGAGALAQALPRAG